GVDPAGVVGIENCLADAAGRPVLAADGLESLRIEGAGEVAERVACLDLLEDPPDQRCPVGVDHASVHDPAVPLRPGLAFGVDLGRQQVAVVHRTAYHLARLPASSLPRS